MTIANLLAGGGNDGHTVYFIVLFDYLSLLPSRSMRISSPTFCRVCVFLLNPFACRTVDVKCTAITEKRETPAEDERKRKRNWSSSTSSNKVYET